MCVCTCVYVQRGRESVLERVRVREVERVCESVCEYWVMGGKSERGREREKKKGKRKRDKERQRKRKKRRQRQSGVQ